jgi:hypothetical protein
LAASNACCDHHITSSPRARQPIDPGRSIVSSTVALAFSQSPATFGASPRRWFVENQAMSGARASPDERAARIVSRYAPAAESSRPWPPSSMARASDA